MDGVAQTPTVVVPAGEAMTTGEQKFSDTGGSGGGALRVDNIKCNGCTPLAPCDCTTKYIEPQNGFIKSETTCMFAKTTVLSSQEIYNDEDIRSVYVNKAPFNSLLFNIMFLFLPAGGALITQEGMVIYGLVALLVGLIAAFFFFLQCCRPTLGVNVFTSRMAFFPCNWSVFMETYKVRGTGPGVSIQDPDDVGHKLLNRSQPENILSQHKGKDIPKQGISQELIITNRRIGFKRRKACCCKLVTLENSLWTYKLDEVANCHADSSFPLFFLIFCVWTLIVGLVAYLWNDSRCQVGYMGGRYLPAETTSSASSSTSLSHEMDDKLSFTHTAVGESDTTVTFTVTYSGYGWFGLGIGGAYGGMDGSDIVICTNPDNLNGHDVERYYASGHFMPIQVGTVVDASCSTTCNPYPECISTMIFTRNVIADNGNEVDIPATGKDVKMIFAYDKANSMILRQHSGSSKGKKTVDLCGDYCRSASSSDIYDSRDGDGSSDDYGSSDGYGTSDDYGSDSYGWRDQELASCNPQDSQSLQQALYVMGSIWFVYFMLLNRCPGGVGCCRKSRIKVYFKSPSPLGFPSLLTDFDEMELPGGVSLIDGVEMTGAQGAANICSEIMRAKADYISKKKA